MEHFLQTQYMYSTLKRSENDHVVSRWNAHGVFVGLVLKYNIKTVLELFDSTLAPWPLM